MRRILFISLLAVAAVMLLGAGTAFASDGYYDDGYYAGGYYDGGYYDDGYYGGGYSDGGYSGGGYYSYRPPFNRDDHFTSRRSFRHHVNPYSPDVTCVFSPYDPGYCIIHHDHHYATYDPYSNHLSTYHYDHHHYTPSYGFFGVGIGFGDVSIFYSP